MSYTEIIPFKNNLPQEGIIFSNAWGGAARIWTALFDQYLKNPAIPYHSWLMQEETKKLWGLAQEERLELFERIVLAATFDGAYILNENFSAFALSLRKFVKKYPVEGRVDHLSAWADWIEQSDAQAVGFHLTSVCENPWYDSEDSPRPFTLGFNVYGWGWMD